MKAPISDRVISSDIIHTILKKESCIKIENSLFKIERVGRKTKND